MAHVSWLSFTPVKALALEQLDAAEVREDGLRGDRRFYLVDANGRLVNNKGSRRGPLQLVHASYDEDDNVLRLRLPDGREIAGETTPGDELTTQFHRWPKAARRVEGPWDEALSDLVDEHLRLVAPSLAAPDRGRGGAVSLLGDGSLRALSGALGVDDIDDRRFRMNIGVEGLAEHEEDGWVGRRVQVGEAVVVPQGHVGRCAITTQNPDTGKADLDTLKALAAYRGELETTEPLPFGVHAAVAEPGAVRLGDAVTPL